MVPRNSLRLGASVLFFYITVTGVCGPVCVHMCLNLPLGELEVVKLKFPEVLKGYEN